MGLQSILTRMSAMAGGKLVFRNLSSTLELHAVSSYSDDTQYFVLANLVLHGWKTRCNPISSISATFLLLVVVFSVCNGLWMRFLPPDSDCGDSLVMLSICRCEWFDVLCICRTLRAIYCGPEAEEFFAEQLAGVRASCPVHLHVCQSHFPRLVLVWGVVNSQIYGFCPSCPSWAVCSDVE